MLLFLLMNNLWAQEDTQVLDSLEFRQAYGIRVGVDISRPIIQMLQKEDVGLELTLDYRVTDKWYAAAEFGYESEPGEEDYIKYHTKGSYGKLGFNYNLYENWKGINNEVYAGLRYGFSSFQQELNSFSAVDLDNYFGSYTASPGSVYENLNAHWAEIHIGIKVETLPNLFLTAGIHFKKLIKDKKPEGFANLYIPGFNAVLLNKNAVGFNYTISYLIPFKKK